MVSIRVLIPPGGIESGTKRLLIPGLSASTIKSSEAGPWLPALEVRSPETFVCVSMMLLVTLTATMHELPAPSLPPLRLIAAPPSGAASKPSIHDVVALAGDAIVMPVGRVSVNARSVTGLSPAF